MAELDPNDDIGERIRVFRKVSQSWESAAGSVLSKTPSFVPGVERLSILIDSIHKPARSAFWAVL
jgi:hypothetical protein